MKGRIYEIVGMIPGDEIVVRCTKMQSTMEGTLDHFSFDVWMQELSKKVAYFDICAQPMDGSRWAVVGFFVPETMEEGELLADVKERYGVESCIMPPRR